MEVSNQLHAPIALLLAEELTIEQEAKLAPELSGLWWQKKKNNLSVLVVKPSTFSP
jgi:hypothetical protein